MDVVCWLQSPCHHYLGIFRELAEIWEGNIKIVFENHTDQIHKDLTLQVPEMGKLVTCLSDTDKEPIQRLASKIIDDNSRAYHIYFGFNSLTPFFKSSASVLMKKNMKLIIMSERPRQYTFFMGLAREILYHYRVKKYRSGISAVLALGCLGAKAFNRFGFENEKIFPFQYCVDHTKLPQEVRPVSSPLRFIHLAGLQESHRKGLDVIFNAFSNLKELDWSCDILGFDPTDQLRELLRLKGIDQKIHLLGKCKNTEVFSNIRQNDILLLPSRHDGWGVALAEGIFCGLGSIASDNTGSKDLVEGFQCGKIVKAGNVQSLTEAIRDCIENREIVKQWKTNAVEHHYRLTAEYTANYLKQILEYVFLNDYQGKRPVAPWCIQNEQREAVP